MKSRKVSEEELASVAECYFAAKGWDLYPEVVLDIMGGRADFIGKRNGLCMVAECKRALSYPVLEQLTRWHHEMASAIQSKYADESKKAIPHLMYAVVHRSGAITPLKQEIIDRYRIGVLEISLEEHQGWSRNQKEGSFDDLGYGYVNGIRWRVHETFAPKIQHGSRRTAHRIIEKLDPDMKCGVPGSSGKCGDYMTPFKRTIRRATAVLDRGGDWHISLLVREINESLGGHHYSSDVVARNCISKFLVEQGIAERIDSSRPIFRRVCSVASTLSGSST